MSEHFQFLEIINSLSEKGYGRKFGTAEEAEQHFMKHPQEMAAYASLNLVRGFNEFIKSMSKASSTGRKDDMRAIKRPDWARKLPDGVGIGDRVFSFETDGGLYERVVVGFDTDGFPLISYCGEFEQGEWLPAAEYVCGSNWCTDKAKAIEAGCNSDIRYHTKELIGVMAAMAALAAEGPACLEAEGVNEEVTERYRDKAIAEAMYQLEHQVKQPKAESEVGR